MSDAKALLERFLFAAELPEEDIASYLAGIEKLSEAAAARIMAANPQPNRWTALIAELDALPEPALLDLLLASYRRYFDRPNAQARERLDALVAKYPELEP